LTDPAVIARLNRQAAVLTNVFFPSQVLAALSLEDHASVTAVRLALSRFREEAGPPQDGVEAILLDQLLVAHLKIGELHALAAQTPRLEFKQLYSNAGSRLIAAVCQLVTTLASYRSSVRPRRRRPRKVAHAPEESAVDHPTSTIHPPAGEEKRHSKQGSKGARGRP
jgi:hypothetical protein